MGTGATAEGTAGAASASRRRLAAAGDGFRTGLLALALGLTFVGVALPGPAPARYVAPAPAHPVRLVIPSQDVVAPVSAIGMLPGRVLMPPEDHTEVGWWDVSARPGARKGQTVITGHAVHDGDGALNDVTALEKGRAVRVVSRKGTVRYRVTRVEVLSRSELAERAEQLFGQGTGGGRLVLVSCTDWNGTAFENNVVVLARPL